MTYYDKILSCVGEFGLYQKRACLLLSILAISVGVHNVSVVFNNFTPEFRCAIPGMANDTYWPRSDDHRHLLNDSLPYDADKGEYSACKVFARVDKSEGNGISTTKKKSQACERWVYDDQKDGLISVATEFNFVCEREIYKAHNNMMILIGLLVGSLIGGTLSDYFGRKKLSLFCILAQNIVGVAMAFTPSIPVIMALRMMSVTFGTAAYIGIYVLLAEIVGVSRRSIATLGCKLGYGVGLFVVCLVQFLFRNWRTAQLVQSVPFLALVSFWWLIEESPRWLITQRRLEEANSIILHIAKVNKVNLASEMAEHTDLRPIAPTCINDDNGDVNFDKTENPPTKKLKLWHLFSQPKIAIRITILCFLWSTVTLVYYGLSLGVGTLIEGDIYLNHTLQSIMELIAYLLCIAFIERVGRKQILCSAMILSGLSVLGISVPVLAQKEARSASVSLYCLGKLGITVAFTLVYIVTAEILPTKIRNSGLGFCSSVARVSGIASPYIVTAGLYIAGPVGQAFPLIIFGGMSLLSGISSIWLPETRNTKLPESFDDNDQNDHSDNKDGAHGNERL